MVIVNVSAIPVSSRPATRKIIINASRYGVKDNTYKEAVIWDDLASRNDMAIIPFEKNDTQERVFLAKAIDGRRAIMLYGLGLQSAATVITPNITADIALNIDLNDGTGGGGSIEPTDPATAPAVIRVNKQPAIREVLAVEKRTDGTWRFAGNTLISKTGDLELQVTGGEVYAIGVDDFGIPYQAGLELELGQTVRPTLFQGWLYECTEVGQLPGTEPTWWPEEGENPPRLVGTARLQAVRYYQPIAHGPIHYELI